MMPEKIQLFPVAICRRKYTDHIIKKGVCKARQAPEISILVDHSAELNIGRIILRELRTHSK